MRDFLVIRVYKGYSFKMHIKIILFIISTHRSNVIDLGPYKKVTLVLNRSIGTITVSTLHTAFYSQLNAAAVIISAPLINALAYIFSVWRMMFGFLFSKLDILCHIKLFSRYATRITGFFRDWGSQIRKIFLLRDFIDLILRILT